jgi:O-antigen ligase
MTAGSRLGRLHLISQFRYTRAALFATTALSVAYNLRWHIGFYPTTLLELAIVVTVAVFIVEALLHRRWPEWRTPFTWPAALFILAGLLSIIVAPDRRAAAGLFRAYIVEPIAIFFIASVVIRTWRHALLVASGLGVAGLVVAILNIVAVLQAVAQHNADISLNPPVAIYQSANAVALFLVPLIAVAASLLLFDNDRITRIGSGVFLAIAGLATVLSFSRGGYLALLVVALGLVVSHPRRRLLVPVALVGAVLVALIPPVSRRIVREINLADPHNSMQGRFQLWRATLRMLRDHPIFGTGLSSFQRSINVDRGDDTENLIYPHNILLNFWTETGILGVVAFAWIVFQAIRVPLRGLRRGLPQWRPIHRGVLLAIVGILVHGMVDVPYWKNDLSLEFWVLLALTWAGVRWANQDSSERYTSTVR